MHKSNQARPPGVKSKNVCSASHPGFPLERQAKVCLALRRAFGFKAWNVACVTAVHCLLRVRSWHWHRRYCQAGSRPRHGYAALDASLCDTPGRFVIQTAFWGSRSPGDSPGPSGLVGVPYIPGWVFWMAGDGSVWGQSGGSIAVRGPGRRSERFSGCGACGWPGMGLKASQGALGSVFDRGWLWSRLGGWQMVTE